MAGLKTTKAVRRRVESRGRERGALRKTTARFTLPFLVLFLTVVLGSLPTAEANDGPTISGVSLNHRLFRPGKGNLPQIGYRLNKEARVTIRVYDENDVLVKTLARSEKASKGDRIESWDGTDHEGRVVVPGIYRFTIEAEDDKGRTVRSDLTDVTGGKEDQVLTPRIDAKEGVVTYVLKSPCLVVTRLGLGRGGPFLRTLEFMKAKPAGLSRVPWDGMDQSGVVRVMNHPKLELNVQAYSLNDNAVVVLNEGDGPDRGPIPERRGERRLKTKTARKVLRYHWGHDPSVCRDYELRVTLSGDQDRDTSGIPVVKGPLNVRVDAAEADRAALTEQRFEIMFFTDFVFVHEEEAGFLPYNWTWEPRGLTEGVHYLTVNVIGYEGHFGTRTVKVKF